MNESGQWTTHMYDYSGSGLDGNTSTCNPEEGFPLPFSMITANVLRYAQIVLYLVCFATAFLLNVFVIFITVRFKKLHNITFYLALQLVITDFINAILFYPTSATNAIANRFVFTGLCPLIAFIFTFLFTARNLLMFVLVADRFFLIFLPFWYSRHRVKVVIPLSIGAWVLSFSTTLIPAVVLNDCYGFRRIPWICLLGQSCRFNPACGYYIAFQSTLTNGGTFVALLLYSGLLCRAKKLKNKIAISHSNESAEVIAAVKNARKREKQANTTFLIMFIALVGVTLPPYILFILKNVLLSALNVNPATPLAVTVITLGNLYSLIFIMDPIVIMRNQDVREVVQGIVAKLRRSRRVNVLNNSVDAAANSDTRNSEM